MFEYSPVRPQSDLKLIQLGLRAPFRWVPPRTELRRRRRHHHHRPSAEAFSRLSGPLFAASMATSSLQLPVSLHNSPHRIKLQIFPSFGAKCLPGIASAAGTSVTRVFVAARLRKIKAFAAVRSVDSVDKSETLATNSVEPLGARNDFQRELQDLFAEVKRMIASGKETDAVALLQANMKALEEQMEAGAKGIEELATLDIIAMGYMAVGDLKAVGIILDKMNELAGDVKDDNNLLGSVLMHMGSMYSALGKYDTSVLMYQRAVGIFEGIYGKDSTFLVTPLLGMAKALGCIGKATKAVQTYQDAITILQSSRGFESEDLVVPLLALGNLLIKEGKPNDAENLFTRVVSIYTKVYEENDGRVGLALSSLAHVKCVKGDVEGAIHSYRKALQIMKESSYDGLDDGTMERIKIDLAELLHIVGRGDEGRQLLEECLLITEQQNGEGHPSSVTHLVNIASSYSRSKNYVEAERLLRAALEIMIRTLGPDDQSITLPMLNLAITLYNLKRDDEAEQLAMDVIRIREKAFGKDSLPVGEALDCLVSIQARLGKQGSELVALLQRVLRIQEMEFGYESEEVMVTLKKIVFYLDKLGRKDEKYGLQKRLMVLKSKHKQEIQY